jgi:predicted dehydrogenase
VEAAVPDRLPTFAVLGAGGRGGTYARWIAEHPDRARVVAVAEPRDFQRNRIAQIHGLSDDRQFRAWEDLLAAGRLADAVIVATQDAHHVAPAVAAARAGYHILLEKPMAPDPKGCREIVDAVHAAGVHLAVCHVMRYTPYTRLVKGIVDSGRIGAVMSVQHLEPVGFWHQAHSFVRGNWRREDESSPMLLAKSCHDIDWLRHIVGRPIERVSSFGHLSHFRADQAPEGAGERCVDCRIEDECPYSAKRFYLQRVREGRLAWPVNVITDDTTEAGVLAALRDGPYGRCVYHCDNDVVDHQVVNLEFSGGISANFTMTAFTKSEDRKTRIFGTHGTIHGDGEKVEVFNFRTEQTEVFDVPSLGADAATGHGGGDAGLMDAFARALASGDFSGVLSGPDESLETHLAVFAAEDARHAGTVERVLV